MNPDEIAARNSEETRGNLGKGGGEKMIVIRGSGARARAAGRRGQEENARAEGKRKGPVLLGLLTVAQFVVVLDFTIVQVALPAIRSSLHISVADSTWLISAYGIMLAGFLILSGRISDIHGRRRFFIIGLLIFSLSSLVGGLAPSFAFLLGARVVQGVGAALAAATGLSLIIALYAEGEERNKAISVFTAAAAGAFGTGLILGGALTASFGWRSVMFVNVPIGLVAAALSSKYVVESRGRDKSEGLDIPGAATVTAGLMVLDFGLTSAQTSGIGSPLSLGPMVISASLFAAFLLIERRARSPLVPLAFLRRRTIFIANAAALLTSGQVGGMLFIAVLYFQGVLKYPVLLTGLAFAPAGIVSFTMGGFVSKRMIARLGTRATLALAASAEAAGFLVLTQIEPSQDYVKVVLPALVILSLGTGAAFPAFRIAATSGTKKGEEGTASGLVNTSQQMGSPLGVTALMAIAAAAAPDLAKGTVSAAAVTGFRYAFAVGALLALISLLMSLMIQDKKAGTAGRR
jgi:MFS family permease